MLACSEGFSDWYMENDTGTDRALPYEVIAVGNAIRDFCNEQGEVKRVGNYFIGKAELGEGMFAKVKKGMHALTGQLVAIKVTDKKKNLTDYLMKHLHREAKLLKRLRHPNIVQAYEVMETDSKYYLVMEFCSRGDLMRYVEQGGALNEKETRKYMRQLVSAIDYLHQASILHRDFKLENILFDSEKNVKLIDFGLSNDFGGDTACGSPAYSSPEVLGAKQYGPEADIWSLGVNMFGMLTATLPYSIDASAKNVVTLLHAKMLERKMNPIPNHLSPECKDLLVRLLEFDPAKRIRMEEILVHPWICQSQATPLCRCIFPNQLKDDDLNNDILTHMCKFMQNECTASMSQLIMTLLNHELSADAAIYYLLEKKLLGYEQKQSKELISQNRRRKKSFSETDVSLATSHLFRDQMKRATSFSKKSKSLNQRNMKRIQSERNLPHMCPPDTFTKQRVRHPTEPNDTIATSTKLGLPMLSPKSPTEKQMMFQEFSDASKMPLPSMQQRPSTKACGRDNRKDALLQWVNRPMTIAASDRLKRHRSFKAAPTPNPEPQQVFNYDMHRPPSMENLSVATDSTNGTFESPSMLSIHSVESTYADTLDWSRPHGGHLVASPPFVPSQPPSMLQHLQRPRTQSTHTSPPSSAVANQPLPLINQKADSLPRQGRIKKWHSEKIKRRPL